MNVMPRLPRPLLSWNSLCIRVTEVTQMFILRPILRNFFVIRRCFTTILIHQLRHFNEFTAVTFHHIDTSALVHTISSKGTISLGKWIKDDVKINAESKNTHLLSKGKYHCLADLLFAYPFKFWIYCAISYKQQISFIAFVPEVSSRVRDSGCPTGLLWGQGLLRRKWVFGGSNPGLGRRRWCSFGGGYTCR